MAEGHHGNDQPVSKRFPLKARYGKRGVWPWGIAALAALLAAMPAGAREVMGWLEPAQLEPEGIRLTAKLDTGADRSSLGAADIQVFSADGRDRVRFRPQIPGEEVSPMERPLLRITKIKRHGEPAEARPVVRLRICLGDLSKDAAVSLADRSNFEQPLLIGRDFLSGNLLVDPAATFTTEPRCAPMPSSE